MGFENHFPLGKHSLFKQMNPRYAVDDETYLTPDLNLTEKVSSWNINHSEIDRFKLLSEYIIATAWTQPTQVLVNSFVESSRRLMISSKYITLVYLNYLILLSVSEKRQFFSLQSNLIYWVELELLFVVQILIYSWKWNFK